MFEGLYAQVARLARSGLNVAVDVGHHDGYSAPLGISERVGEWLAGIPTLWVGVRRDLDEIMRRRAASGPGYVAGSADGSVPEPVLRWQREVHDPGDYDLEVDTTARTAVECAEVIRAVTPGSQGGGCSVIGPE